MRRERERIPPGEFYEILNAANIEYASLSWSGFNVFGDKTSIDEVKRLQHLAALVPELRARLRNPYGPGDPAETDGT
jgi:hypothetical protein